MNTERAINTINNIHTFGMSVDEKRDIFTLLRQGQKYKDMWGELTNCAYRYRDISNNYTHLVDFMADMKQRHFPEEVEKELMRKKLKGLLEVTDELMRLLDV